MTASARLVLYDCETALQALKAKPQGGKWRLAWINVITLLRAAGHVLNKVDASHDTFMRQCDAERKMAQQVKVFTEQFLACSHVIIKQNGGLKLGSLSPSR